MLYFKFVHYEFAILRFDSFAMAFFVYIGRSDDVSDVASPVVLFNNSDPVF